MRSINEFKQVSCRQCGSDDLKFRGAMTQADTFCGMKLPNDWSSGSLYECRHCHLSFRYPVREQSEYLYLYQAAPESTYRSASLRHDQRLVHDAINRHCLGGAILDVGCFDGALLSSLGSAFKKYGIEASKAAQKICREAGIEIIAGSSESLLSSDRKYDVICAVDVVEHLVLPHIFIKDIATRLNSNGLLIISTGNASDGLWKLFGGRYWYCAFPEHISFISPEWINGITKNHPLNVLESTDFSHENINISKVSAYARFVGRLVRGYAESISLRIHGDHSLNPKYKLGFPGVVRDHMLVVLQLNTTHG